MGQATVLLVLLGLTGFSAAGKLNNLGNFEPNNNFLSFNPFSSNSQNVGIAKAQFQGSANNIQPSFNFGTSSGFNEALLGDYLPPSPSDPTGISCAPVTVTVTDNSVA